MNVPIILKTLRKSMRINQGVIADRLSLSVSEISRIECGRRRLRVDQLEEWAAALGRRVSVIVYKPASPEQSPLSDTDQALLGTVADAISTMTAREKAMLNALCIAHRYTHSSDTGSVTG